MRAHLRVNSLPSVHAASRHQQINWQSIGREVRGASVGIYFHEFILQFSRIVFVALQNLFRPEKARGQSRLVAAFVFGLFHGLGFAGGLLDVMHQMQTETILVAILGFSLGVEAGNQLVLLPLFAVLKIVRRAQPDAVIRPQGATLFLRINSAAISVAGMYYLCLALTGRA